MSKSPEQLRYERARDELLAGFRDEAVAIELLHEGRDEELPPIKVRWLVRQMAGFVLGELCVPMKPKED